MEPITLNLNLSIISIATVGMYVFISYVVGAMICRACLANVSDYIDIADSLVYFCAWLISPLWIVPHLMRKLLFVGVKHTGKVR